MRYNGMRQMLDYTTVEWTYWYISLTYSAQS